MRRVVPLLLGAVLAGAAAPGPTPGCTFDRGDVAGAPRFEDYPAGPPFRGTPAPPRLLSREARLFRTVIRRAAADGPDFAGHFTVAAWGCGSSCMSGAVVDARSGRVLFPDAMQDVTAIHVTGREPDGSEPPFYALRWRRDSRLLVVVGAQHEDEARDGVAFYLWTGTGLRLLRFVSWAALCGAPG